MMKMQYDDEPKIVPEIVYIHPVYGNFGCTVVSFQP